MSQKSFNFFVKEYPTYFHTAIVNDERVEVRWDSNYKNDVLAFQFVDVSWHSSVKLETVKRWIENGDWIVVGDKTALNGFRFRELMNQFNELEENFLSLKAEFERLAAAA